MMKKMIKLVSATLLALFIFAGPAMGQNERAKVSLERSIRLYGDSKKEEITVTIDKKTENFFLNIDSRIEGGKLTIEVYDPKGEKQGNFSVGTQIKMEDSNKKKGKQENVRGQINKAIQEPMAGIWKITIVPVKAKGYINIETKQLYDKKSKD